MQVIVRTSHDRHRDDNIKVYDYTGENLDLVKTSMEGNWPEGKWGFWGDLPCDNGSQFGINGDFYDSYAIVEVL